MSNHHFVTLQSIDSEIDALRHRRSRLPELLERDRLVAECDGVAAAIRSAEARIAAASSRVEEMERAGAQLATKRARLDAQLKTVIAPREAEALMSEMSAIDSERSALDDAELAVMEEQGDAETELARHSASLPDVQERAAVARDTADRAVALLDAELAVLTDRRAATVMEFPPGDLDLYEQARRHFGGIAVATLEGTHCSGCHLDLSAVELDAVRGVPAGGRTECPQCGRIMVR